MNKNYFGQDYRYVRATLLQDLLFDGNEVDVGEWHAQDVSGKPELVSTELSFVSLRFRVPHTLPDLQQLVEPNLPWAEDHFLERVSGEPLNPAPSEAWWPFAVAGNAQHKDGEIFSHTYPERYWPKMANIGGYTPGGRSTGGVPHVGIRYLYGDLGDVIDLLFRSPLTRQAYLPVWFPEDTGATESQRLPCSLGYHFLLREDRLHVHYAMRSCDFVRHFADDMYMTARLLQFIVGKLRELGMDIREGSLHATISSLHYFAGDRAKMTSLMNEWDVDSYE